MTRSGIARAALVGAAFALVSAPAAQAQEGSLVNGILAAIGIVEADRPDIDYRERAPLVLPPDLQRLPPPTPSGVAEADPAWPQDPDVAAARARAIEARTPAILRPGAPESAGRQLTQDELRRGRLAGAGLVDGATGRGQTGPTGSEEAWIPPQILREMHEARRVQTEETRLQRRFLTDPPQAYLVPDPNAPMPERVQIAPDRTETQTPMEFTREQAAR